MRLAQTQRHRRVRIPPRAPSNAGRSPWEDTRLQPERSRFDSGTRVQRGEDAGSNPDRGGLVPLCSSAWSEHPHVSWPVRPTVGPTPDERETRGSTPPPATITARSLQRKDTSFTPRGRGFDTLTSYHRPASGSGTQPPKPGTREFDSPPGVHSSPVRRSRRRRS